jgi:thioesterase domain-containing protein/acyl carrier protein
MTAETIASPDYWGKQLHTAVLFSDAIGKLVEPVGRVFLEVGPRDVLSTLTRQHVPAKQRPFIISTLSTSSTLSALQGRAGKNSADGADGDYASFLRAVGGLWKVGVSIDWTAFHAGEHRRRVPLPSYPFERTSYWLEPAKTTATPQFPVESAPATEAASEQAQPPALPRTIADHIAAMIAMVAGVPASAVDPSQTYIELGFDSLSLMQLEVVVNQKFGIKVTWRQLLEEHSTPAKLEALVRASKPELDNVAADPSEQPAAATTAIGAAGSTSIQCLTALREAGPRRLFLAYDGEGDVLQYLKLARSMPQDFSIYGLSPLRLPGIPQVHTHVEDMAKHCVSVVRHKQPTGPYMLGGLCAGGVIAFEMARQLEANGEKVEWVVLFDAINPQARFRPFLATRDRLKHFLKTTNGAPPAALARGGSKGPSQGPLFRLSSALHKVRNVVAYGAQAQVDRAWIAARVLLLRRLRTQTQTWPTWLPPVRELDIFMHIKGDYRPTTINADIALVRAEMESEGVDTAAHHFVSDPLFGWSGHTNGTLETIDAAGGHVSMLLDEPWFGELAGKLARVLSSKH